MMKYFFMCLCVIAVLFTACNDLDEHEKVVEEELVEEGAQYYVAPPVSVFDPGFVDVFIEDVGMACFKLALEYEHPCNCTSHDVSWLVREHNMPHIYISTFEGHDLEYDFQVGFKYIISVETSYDGNEVDVFNFSFDVQGSECYQRINVLSGTYVENPIDPWHNGIFGGAFLPQ